MAIFKKEAQIVNEEARLLNNRLVEIWRTIMRMKRNYESGTDIRTELDHLLSEFPEIIEIYKKTTQTY